MLSVSFRMTPRRVTIARVLILYIEGARRAYLQNSMRDG